ncbi:MAG: ABC-type transport auxiliary lipoprotein family protein [Ectothiorhodospiraceae bacterium]|jgi:cholesterol transport system auxiliary component
MRRHATGLAATLLTALVLSACSPISRKATPPERTFQLRTPEIGALADSGSGVLEISRPSASPGYDTRDMAYRESPVELQYYAHSRWTDPPAQMLAYVLTDALDQSGLFRAVAMAPAPVTPDFRLDTDLLRLEQDFTGSPPSQAHITVRIRLLDARGGKLLAAERYDITAPAPAESPEGAAVAANRATSVLVRRIVEMVQRTLTND